MDGLIDFWSKFWYDYNSLRLHQKNGQYINIGKSYKGGKDIVDYYKKRQEEGFQQLKDILKGKNISDMVQEYVERLENVLSRRVIVDLSWDMILLRTREKDDIELEGYLIMLTFLAESYDK